MGASLPVSLSEQGLLLLTQITVTLTQPRASEVLSLKPAQLINHAHTLGMRSVC